MTERYYLSILKDEPEVMTVMEAAKILRLGKNKTYDLVTQPTGDQIIALNINAIKNIGFFMELDAGIIAEGGLHLVGSLFDGNDALRAMI